MATKIQIRRDTAANWTSNNPVLAPGEFGYSTDYNVLKVGDGTTAWSDLTPLPGASELASINDTLDSIDTNLTTLNDHIADGGTDKHTPTQVGLEHVLNTEQVRADASGYSSITSPVSTDKIYARRNDGSMGTIPWSAVPSAATAMTSVEGAAGSDTTAKIISPKVLADTIAARAPGGGTVTSVNSVSPSSGNVTLTQDNIASGSTNKAFTSTYETKLSGIETAATTETECYTNSTAGPFDATNKITLATGNNACAIIPSTAIQRAVKNGNAGAITVHGPEGIVSSGCYFNGSDFAWTVASESWIPTAAQNKFVCSFWLRPTSKASSQYIWSTYNGANSGYVEVQFGGTDFTSCYVQVEAAKAGTPATVTLRQRTAITLFPVDTWKHVLISVDLSTGSPSCQIALNGVLLTLPQSGYTPVLAANDTFQITGTTLRVNKRGNNAGTTIDASLAQLFIAFGTSLDLSNSANVQKFYNSGPVNLGFNGWRPLGTVPNLFMNANSSAFAENLALQPTASPRSATITGTPSSPLATISGVSAAGLIDNSPYVTLAAGGRANFVRQNGTVNYQVW